MVEPVRGNKTVSDAGRAQEAGAANFSGKTVETRQAGPQRTGLKGFFMKALAFFKGIFSRPVEKQPDPDGMRDAFSNLSKLAEETGIITGDAATLVADTKEQRTETKAAETTQRTENTEQRKATTTKPKPTRTERKAAQKAARLKARADKKAALTKSREPAQTPPSSATPRGTGSLLAKTKELNERAEAAAAAAAKKGKD